MSDIKQSLKMRLDRMSRLIDLNAPTFILVNEKSLIDMAMARLINDKAMQWTDAEFENEQFKILIKDLRLRNETPLAPNETDKTDYFYDENGALNLIQAMVQRQVQKGIIDHCEANQCQWFKEEEKETS